MIPSGYTRNDPPPLSIAPSDAPRAPSDDHAEATVDGPAAEKSNGDIERETKRVQPSEGVRSLVAGLGDVSRETEHTRVEVCTQVASETETEDEELLPSAVSPAQSEASNNEWIATAAAEATPETLKQFSANSEVTATSSSRASTAPRTISTPASPAKRKRPDETSLRPRKLFMSGVLTERELEVEAEP